MKTRVLLFIGLTLIMWACNNHPQKKPVVRDTTINLRTSFNNLFLDSVQLHTFLSADTTYQKYEAQYIEFYKQRNYEFAWFDSTGIAEQARNFVNLLDNTVSTMQDSSMFNQKLHKLYSAFAGDSTPVKKVNDILETELLLTGQFFDYASKFYKGSDIDAATLGWYIPRKKISITAVLDSVIHAKGKEADKYANLHPQYKQIETFLSQYVQLEKNEKWDSIPLPKKSLKKGDSSDIVMQIKHRLFVLGDMAAEDSTAIVDSTLVNGAKSFQRRMGLGIDGVIGAKMVQELNVLPSTRVKQMLVNLERLRWLPGGRDSNYVVVNIPEYKLHVYENGEQAFEMNVIVGTAANSTVIFNGNLRYIVFAPYWNVPESIVKNEIMPGIARNSNYIASHNMEITGYSGKVPIVRQKPGPGNSLGKVKFLFPNSYNIYLHDTPNHDLFTSSSRNFSHGCIRLSEPAKMAEYLLRNDPKWTADSIAKSMDLKKEKWITLDKTVPVYILYLTAWVDDNGKLNFRKDIYGHDKKMLDKLFVKAN